MIHYQLRCDEGHGFEGWFRDSGAFEEQSRRKLLSCPRCGTASVQRAMMAPSVRSGKRATPMAAPAGREPETQAKPGEAPMAIPDQLRAALQRLRAEIERRCDDVGDGFAEAARRLHQQGAATGEPPRGIYGQVTETEREALADEGIETTQVPWLPRAEG